MTVSYFYLRMAVKITSIFLVCILTTLSTLAVGKKLSFKKCGGYSDIESVDIPSCSSDPCVLEVGSTINASMSFTPSEMVEKGTIKVFVLAFGLRVPFPYPDNDVCKNHGLVCSLEKSKSRNYGERPKPQNDFLLPNRCHIQVQMNSFIFSMNECELATLDENIQFDP